MSLMLIVSRRYIRARFTGRWSFMFSYPNQFLSKWLMQSTRSSCSTSFRHWIMITTLQTRISGARYKQIPQLLEIFLLKKSRT